MQTWSDKLAEIWTLLTQSPENFKGGAIWSVMTNINGGLTAIGYGLLVLFFAAGLIKTCGSFTDMKKPEHVVKAFIRFALAQGAVMSGMELLLSLIHIYHAMSQQEAEKLIDELLTLENPYHCPHGRPTIIAMTRTELEKKFKRIV